MRNKVVLWKKESTDTSFSIHLDYNSEHFKFSQIHIQLVGPPLQGLQYLDSSFLMIFGFYFTHGKLNFFIILKNAITEKIIKQMSIIKAKIRIEFFVTLTSSFGF